MNNLTNKIFVVAIFLSCVNSISAEQFPVDLIDAFSNEYTATIDDQSNNVIMKRKKSNSMNYKIEKAFNKTTTTYTNVTNTPVGENVRLMAPTLGTYQDKAQVRHYLYLPTK